MDLRLWTILQPARRAPTANMEKAENQNQFWVPRIPPRKDQVGVALAEYGKWKVFVVSLERQVRIGSY